MGFFKRNVTRHKRKLKSENQKTKRVKKSTNDDEILSSEGEVDHLDETPGKHLDEDNEEIYEDVQAKTDRESKRVLEQLKINEKPAGDEASDDDLDAISHRLKKDETVREHRKLADKAVINEESVKVYRPHKFSSVCVAISNSGQYIVSCSKDGSIVKYDLEQNKQTGVLKHSKTGQSHKGQIRCVAISGDDKYIASGGDDKVVRVWLLENLSHVKNFQGHRGPITSLVFRQGSNDLYSASTDRCIRAWDLNQMGFVEIMYGHADSISQMDMLDKPKLLSAGSTARTIHLFKIEQSSQLVFNGLNDCTSVETIAMIDDDHFVSGQMDGSLYVWSTSKKKPVCVVKNAHGMDDDGISPRWIVSIAALPYSDLIVTGSSDGKLKLWKVGENYKTLVLIDEFQLAGFLNDIRFSADGKTLVIAVGQEHRSGRWWKCQEARNSIVSVQLQYGGENDQKAPRVATTEPDLGDSD